MTEDTDTGTAGEPKPDDFGERVIQQFMDLYFLPEIERRKEGGQIETPFALIAAQIVFSPAGAPPEVRLNEEMRISLDATLLDGSRTNQGGRFSMADIAEIHTYELHEEDRDCGHGTLLRTSRGWSLLFDFRRNQDTARRTLSAAREFLQAAREALEREHSIAFVDNLYSAAELAAKSSVLWHADADFRDSANHKAVHARFNRSYKAEGIPEEVSKVFNRLSKARYRFRYLKGDIELDPATGAEWLEAISSFVSWLGREHPDSGDHNG